MACEPTTSTSSSPPGLPEEGQPAFYRQIEETDERFLQEIEPRLGDLEIPVRIVWGSDDAWIPPETAQRLRDLIPSATLRLVEGASHLIHYDAPVALADELRRWLASNRRPDAAPEA